MKRRHFIFSMTSFATAGSGLAQDSAVLRVAKSPTCGCCTAWADEMIAAGFSVEVKDVDQDTLWAMKDGLDINDEISSCHTALIGDYFVEGHVPAREIWQMISERPNARGLAVPGMPMGSPGMGTVGSGDPFDVFLVQSDGSTRVLARYS